MKSLLIVIWVSKSSKYLQMTNEDAVEIGGESSLFALFNLYLVLMSTHL